MSFKRRKRRFTGRARKFSGHRLDQYAGERGGIRL